MSCIELRVDQLEATRVGLLSVAETCEGALPHRYKTLSVQILTDNGASSSSKPLPGSSPQGAFLGIFFFVIKYNAASLRPSVPRIILNNSCKMKMKSCKTVGCPKHAKDMHALYIDDLTETVAVNLKKQVVNDPVQRPFPLNFHERNQQVLPSGSILQVNLEKIEDFTNTNLMKINEKKSKVMIFNKSRKYDFPPEFCFADGEILDCVEETKLLGIIINSSLKWNSNTGAIYIKAMSKMWLLRRMKQLNLDSELIFDYYIKEIRSIAEQGVVVWNSGLTNYLVNELEKIQKVAMKIILSEHYTSYETACTFFNVATLSSRRTDLCTNYAIKLYKSKRCDQFFTPYSTRARRKQKKLVKENLSRTTRCYNAPHNYLARLVNANQKKIENSL